MNKKTLFKKILSLLLAIMLILPPVSEVSMAVINAAENATSNEKVYEHDGYTVVYKVASEWEGYRAIEVTLKNTSTKSITNWALSIDNTGDMTGLWNAVLSATDVDKHTVKCMDYNNTIQAGQSVTFGYTLKGTDLSVPDDISMCAVESVLSEGFDVEYKVTGDWGTGFQGEIKIVNESEETIEGWKLNFKGNFDVLNYWNCELIENADGTYTITHTSWQNSIPAGGEYVIGFVGSKTDDEMVISDVKMIVTGSGAGSGETETDPTSPSESETSPVAPTEPVTEPTTEAPTESETSTVAPTEPVTTEPVTNPIEPDEPTIPNIGEKIADLYALGIYNREFNSIDIEWFSDSVYGKYEVMMSDDGIKYDSIATVASETKYQYIISEAFVEKFFVIKASTDSGEVVESIPFSMVKSDNDYTIKFVDSDGDGLPDVMEPMNKTDIHNPDTDGDGLNDFQEVFLTGTNPVVYDSVIEGMADSEVDVDQDNLTNLEEVNLGTNPQNADSDYDLLLDGEEFNCYKTDPLKADTDDDTLSDYDEINIGLNPNDIQTYDMPDAEYKFEQKISVDSEALSQINVAENAYKLSLDINATGYVEGNLLAEETGYSKIIQNDAIIGIPIELDYGNHGSIESVKLNFTIDEQYLENTVNLFPDEEELQGIKRLNVFKYFEDLNMLLPIETFHDIENNLVYANTDELGTYCIMDMEKWLAGFEVPEEVYMQSPSVMALSEDGIEEDGITVKAMEEDVVDFAEVMVIDDLEYESELVSDSNLTTKEKNAKIEIVFAIQTFGSKKEKFDKEIKVVKGVVNDLKSSYNDVKVAIIEWNREGAQIYRHSENDIWFDDINSILDDMEFTYNRDGLYPNKAAIFKVLQSEVEFDEEASKFVIAVFNGAFQNYCTNQIRALAYTNINYSEFKAYFYMTDLSDFAKHMFSAINQTKGITEYLKEDSQKILFEHICKYVSYDYRFDAIVPTGWKTIILDDELNIASGTDTDKDGIPDWDEVDTSQIKWDANGDIVLPTVYDYIEATEKTYGKNSLSRFATGQWSDEHRTFINLYLNYVLYNTHVLPIKSDPTEIDTDGDGLLDGKSIVINEGTESEKIVAPKDVDVMKYNGPRNLWKTHIEQVLSGEKLATGYSWDYYPISDYKVLDYYLNGTLYKTQANWEEIYMSLFSMLGSFFLGFRYDDRHMALHSDTIQWQAVGGYNDFYDKVFDYFTSMAKEKIVFNSEGQDYVIWAWKGNYLNMGAGAEVGFYKKVEWLDDVTDLEHWTVSNMFPMTLSLYGDKGDDTYSTYYNWIPDKEQWWITGFVPNPTDYSVEANELYAIASVDFSKNKEMYQDFEKTYLFEKAYSDITKVVILDKDRSTIWLVW